MFGIFIYHREDCLFLFFGEKNENNNKKQQTFLASSP